MLTKYKTMPNDVIILKFVNRCVAGYLTIRQLWNCTEVVISSVFVIFCIESVAVGGHHLNVKKVIN